MYSPCHIESSGWCADQQALQRGKKKPQLFFCQFPWCKYPHGGQFQATSIVFEYGVGKRYTWEAARS